MADHAAAERKPGALPAPPSAVERPPPPLRHSRLEERAQGPRPVQTGGSGAVAQLKLNTKGSKIDGAAKAVKAEVTATIARDKPDELLTDIARLDTSIAFRAEEQKAFKVGTPEYDKHQGRIEMETKLRTRLQDAYDANKAARDAAKALLPQPAPLEDGWQTQKRRK